MSTASQSPRPVRSLRATVVTTKLRRYTRCHSITELWNRIHPARNEKKKIRTIVAIQHCFVLNKSAYVNRNLDSRTDKTVHSSDISIPIDKLV